jgi:hypothetical protein
VVEGGVDGVEEFEVERSAGTPWPRRAWWNARAPRSRENSSRVGVVRHYADRVPVRLAWPRGEGMSNGAGKAAFDSFQARADEIADALNGSLGAAGVRASGGAAAITAVGPCAGVL